MYRAQRSSSVSRLNATGPPMGRNRSSSTSRLSQNSFSRRSSFVEQDKRAKDNRPLSERSYQSKCILKLVQFLKDNSYEYPISQKMLTSPFSKDVFRIFECIYSSFNPGYKISKKPEEDILQIVKNVQYPFTLTKSTLQNAGSSRSWAAVLGMFMWLMEISQYSNATSGEFARDAGSNVVMPTYVTLAKSFGRFLETGLDQNEEEEKKCYEKIAGLDDANEKHSRAEEVYEGLENQLNDLDLQEVNLRESEDKRRVLCTDVQHLTVYISGMVERIAAKIEDLTNMTLEFQKEGIILTNQQKENEELQKVCQEQNEKGENMHQVRSRSQEMWEKLNREEEQLTQLKQQKLSIENQLSRLKSKVDELCRTFSDLYSALTTSVPHEMHLLEVFEARYPGCSKVELERITNHTQSLSKKLNKELVIAENKLIQQEGYRQELELQMTNYTQDFNDKNTQMEEQKKHYVDILAKEKAKLDQVEAHEEAITQSISKMVEILAVSPEQKQVYNNQLRQQLEEHTEEKIKFEDEMIKRITDESQKSKGEADALEKEDKDSLDLELDYLKERPKK